MDPGEGIEKDLLNSRIAELEARESALIQEKKKMEEDFGFQRAKLKDLFMHKEVDLQSKTEETLTLIAQLDEEKAQVRKLQLELEEARSQATIAQCTAENDIEIEKRKCEEEVATLNHLMEEELCSAHNQIDSLKKQLAIYDAERQHYRILYEQKVEDGDIKKTDGLLSSGVLNAVSKSIAKKVPSLSPAHSSPSSEKSTSGMHAGSTSLATSAILGTDQSENLEDSMKRAQEDATVLRSLLVPLEEEIGALKDKIREQDAQLRAHETREQMDLRPSDVLGPLFQGKSSEELVQELDEKLQGVKNSLKIEKGTRADLEFYTAILNTQKTALQNCVDHTQKELSEIRKRYNEERKSHNDLRNTWKRANDQYLTMQRQNLVYVSQIRSLLTPEQLKKLHNLQQNTSKDISLPSRSIPVSTEELKRSDSLLLGSEPIVNTNDSQKDFLIDTSLEEREVLSQEENLLTCDNVPAMGLLDSGEEFTNEKKSLNGDFFNGNSTECLMSRFSPEKLPQLTDDQKHALSAADLDIRPISFPLKEDEENVLPLVDIESPSNDRIVSDTEWAKLQDELKRSKEFAVENCHLCSGLESQLKKAENDLRECEKQKSIFEKAVERQKEELKREAHYRKTTEQAWKQMAEEFSIKEKNLQAMTDKINKGHSKFMSKFKQDELHLQEKFKNVSKKHKTIQKELFRLQKDNDDLIGKHSQHSQEMQNEIINLPESMEEMQLLLLKYREDVIAAKVAKENAEDKLKSEILFLKNQVLAEQHEKNSMESRLMSELDQLRDSAGMVENLQEELASEKDSRTQADSRVHELEQKSQDSLTRSQQFITGLKKEVENQKEGKKNLELMVVDLKNRIGTLQRDLKNSEDVQKDFVMLSQSLQVKLEKIRQSEEEVRWQHEEDVNDCNNCNQRFSAVGRRKHHCRHCGKIFCSDCVTKTVQSGPNNRISRVCDVCHTLLVRDATPFFSTEPPQLPD